MSESEITYNYCFDFPNGEKKRFLIRLDGETALMKSSPSTRPDWTRLGEHQCPCCRLDRDKAPHCPIAVNISELVTAFRDILSHESCTVTCITTERTVVKETIVQDGLSSIMGIIMATSGCPTLDILRPMARFHLPFATVEESMFRSVSIYLFRQYFIERDGGHGDFTLSRIKTYWEQIETVNEGILKRIKYATELDADRNAIVILNCLAQILPMEVDEELNSLKPFFFRKEAD